MVSERRVYETMKVASGRNGRQAVVSESCLEGLPSGSSGGIGRQEMVSEYEGGKKMVSEIIGSQVTVSERSVKESG